MAEMEIGIQAPFGVRCSVTRGCVDGVGQMGLGGEQQPYVLSTSMLCNVAFGGNKRDD